MNRVDVVNLEWTSYSSRDRLMATLVCNYLRLSGFKVVEGSVFNGMNLIHRHRPKLVFITNAVGAPENLAVVKYAKAVGCKVVTLISEGTFQGDSEYVSEMIWGWNKQFVLFEDLHMQWSTRTRDLTLALHPELRGKVKVSGAVGFDNYKLSLPISKESFLEKWGKEKYQYVVGVGLWDFGCVCFDEDPRYAVFSALFSKEEIARFERDRVEFNRIMIKVIRSHPDILFLLKQHPGVIHGFRASAIEGTEDFDNVLIVPNAQPIIDCIAASDLWLVYESTTALEAWLLGKPTFLLNPSGRDFPRNELHTGSPHVENSAGLADMLESFVSTGELPGFNALANNRQQLIEDIIQWADGHNHIRAGNEIIDFLVAQNGVQQPYRETFSALKERWKQRLKWMIHRGIGRLGYVRNPAVVKWNERELHSFAQRKHEEQQAFYGSHGLDLKSMRDIRALR